MKKTILSLAALMMMTAPVMTSCSNDLDEVEVAPVEEQGDVVTITLKVEQEPETRVGFDNETFNLTGWTNGDKVMLYNCEYDVNEHNSNQKITGEGVVFTCTDASTGTFSGTLNPGTQLSDYTLAVYGGTAGLKNNRVYLEPNKYVSDKIEDLIVLGGFFDGNRATLKIINNIMKVDNASGGDVETAWDYRMTDGSNSEDYYFNPDCWIWFGEFDAALSYVSDYAEVKKYILKSGLNYLYMSPMPSPAYKIGLVTSDGGYVIPQKSRDRYEVGKLYNAGTYTKTTSGLVMAKTIKETWVQLWEGGPKFADHNVGAYKVTERGTTMTFTEATAAGDGYVWGDNWRTPSQSEMDELYKAATAEKSTKVTCEYTQVDGVWGFKFTGKETGYTKNSVFFPASDGSNGSNGAAQYWSGTASGDHAWLMSLRKITGGWSSDWTAYPQSQDYFVRPVVCVR